MRFVLTWFSAMANIAIPGMAVTYRALLLCVSRASTGLSRHGVGVEPLFCLDFWDRSRACTRGGGVTPCQCPPPLIETHSQRMVMISLSLRWRWYQQRQPVGFGDSVVLESCTSGVIFAMMSRFRNNCRCLSSPSQPSQLPKKFVYQQ